MALKEQDIVFTGQDTSGNTVIQMPITRASNVEDLTTTCLPLSGGNLSGNLTVQDKNVVRSVNGTAADASGNVVITVGYHTGNATSIGGASTTKPAVVVTSYRSGTQWYRKYSDGWIEQGGYFKGASNGDHSITLPTAFSGTDYTALALNDGKIAHDAFNGFGVNGKTTTQLTIYSWTGATAGFYWMACGY